MLRRALVLMSLVFGLLSSTTMAEDVFFRVRVQDIKFIDGDVPEYQAAQPDLKTRQRVARIVPEVQLDEPGEAYVEQGDWWSTVFSWTRARNLKPVFLCVRSPERRDVTGRLVLPKPDGSGLLALKFRLSADQAEPNAARLFQFAKIEHYARQASAGGPGQAWYRHQALDKPGIGIRWMRHSDRWAS
jgi:hypothetical protein